MQKRIAFITESATRKDDPMPAFEFYQSSKSGWVNKIIEYLEVREFAREDMYFLSFHEQRVLSAAKR